jgi:hypothetical protein
MKQKSLRHSTKLDTICQTRQQIHQCSIPPETYENLSLLDAIIIPFIPITYRRFDLIHYICHTMEYTCEPHNPMMHQVQA